MDMQSLRKIAQESGKMQVEGKYATAFGLIKTVGEQQLTSLIKISCQKAQHELLSVLINFQYLKYREKGNEDMIKKKLVFDQRIQLDSIDLSELDEQSLAGVLRCFEIRREKGEAFLQIKVNKLRIFFKSVKVLIPDFCQGQKVIIDHANLFFAKLLKMPYPREWPILQKLFEKVRRLTLGVCLGIETNFLQLMERQNQEKGLLQTKELPIYDYENNVDVPPMGIWSQSCRYMENKEELSESDDDPLYNMLSEELDLLSDQVENMLINRALNLIYLPRRRYSQDLGTAKDDLSVCMAKSGKEGNSKFAQLLSKY